MDEGEIVNEKVFGDCANLGFLLQVGVVSPGVPMEIALNKESKRKTASVVGFKDGIRSFGEDAQNIGVRFPPNSYGYLIDLLGKTIDNPIVDLYKYVIEITES